MPMDVIDLRDFYGRPLGRVARSLIGQARESTKQHQIEGKEQR